METETPSKLCICGQSGRYPLCDGSHGALGWQCDVKPDTSVGDAFLASPSLRTVAERLAHRFEGLSVHGQSALVRAERLVVITDGQDLALLQRTMQRVERATTRVIAVGVSATVLAWAFPHAPIVEVPGVPGPGLWNRLEAVLGADALPPRQRTRPKVFLSHAVLDESVLFPVLTALRRDFGMQIFVCADSIPAGSVWRDEIRGALADCDVFVFVASRSANTSVFCSFEMGMAWALGKPIHVLNLDATPHPGPIEDLQAIHVPRLQTRKPWLTHSAAILEAFLSVLAPAER